MAFGGCAAVLGASEIAPVEGVSWTPFLGGGERRTFEVADYGAKPDDDDCDARAVLACFDAAVRSGGPSEVVFAPGRYVLGDLPEAEDLTAGGDPEKPLSRKHLIRLNGARDLVVRGNGAELEMTNISRKVFALFDCRSVLIEDLRIALAHDPFLAGTVVEAGGGSFKFAAHGTDAGKIFPILAEQIRSKKSVFGYFLDDEIPGRLRAGTENHFHVEAVSEGESGEYDFTVVPRHVAEVARIPKGARVVLWSRDGGGIIFLSGGADVTLRRVMATRLNGSMLAGVGCNRVAVLGCEARIAPGQWVSQAADFVHCQAVRQGPWVEDCFVEGIGDDSLVIYTRPYTAKAPPEGGKLDLLRMATSKQAGPLLDGELVAGDSLVFIEPSSGRVLGRSVVVAWSPENSVAELEPAAPELFPWGETNATQIFNENHGNEFVLRRNTLQNNRRYGIYIKAGRGLIEGNRIVGQSSSAIALQNEPTAPNGPFCHDIIIRGNVISDCGFEGAFLRKPHAGVIGAYGITSGFSVAKGIDGHRNLVIENNELRNWGNYGIALSTLTGATVAGNRLIGQPGVEKGILLGEVADVSVEDNVWVSPESAEESPVVPVGESGNVTSANQ